MDGKGSITILGDITNTVNNIHSDRHVPDKFSRGYYYKTKKTELQINKFSFSVQSGCLYDVTPNEFASSLLDAGIDVKRVTGWNVEKMTGSVELRALSPAHGLLNKRVQVKGEHGELTVHTFYCYDSIGEDPVDFQVLVEASKFPVVWERHQILSSHFAQFGEVTAVTFLKRQQMCALVSFRDSHVAASLINSQQEIGGANVKVREVSSKTLSRLVKYY